MPGFTLIIRDHWLGDYQQAIISPQTPGWSHHSVDYHSKTVFEDEKMRVGYSCYSGYPVAFSDSAASWQLFEGHAYNTRPSVALKHFADIIVDLKDGEDILPHARRWLEDNHGDYILLVCDKKRSIVYLLNDPMGRLPVYIYRAPGLAIVSREVKHVVEAAADYEYDNMAMAETLVFGYTLGSSTLIKDVHRLDGGTLLSIDVNSLHADVRRVYEFNFDDLLDKPRLPVIRYAREMCGRFLAGCENLQRTFPDHTHIVSLSGGFDSRAVLAGMKRAGANVRAFSFEDSSTGTRGRDSRYAKEVANIMGVPWELVQFPGISVEEMERLLWVKDGMNYAGMAFLLPIFRKLLASYGPQMIHLTGDNGDRSMDPQGPSRRLKTFDDYARFIIERHTRIPMKSAAMMCGVRADDLEANIRHKLERYPEKDNNNRYRHFIMAERLFNWNFQAEDRNRTYFWHATPFSYFSYFEYAMSVPDAAKKHWRVYEEFFRLLEPKCLQVNYANWEAKITSYRRFWNPLRQSVYERLPTRLRIRVRDATLYRGYSPEGHRRDYLEQCLLGLGSRAAFIDVLAVREFARACNINSFENILSFIAFIKVYEERTLEHRFGLDPQGGDT